MFHRRKKSQGYYSGYWLDYSGFFRNFFKMSKTLHENLGVWISYVTEYNFGNIVKMCDGQGHIC